MSVADTEQSTVLLAAAEALRAMDGTGAWRFDVSNAVQIGHPAEPPTAYPCAFVGPGALELNQPPGTPLGQYECAYTMSLYMFVAASATTVSDGTIAGSNALFDLLKAVAADKSLGGIVHLMQFDSAGSSSGNDADGLGIGRSVAAVEVSVKWTRSIG